MGAAVALLVAALLVPWAEAGSDEKGVVDGGIPWLVGLGGVADGWLLVVAAAVALWALLIAAVAGRSQPIWLAAVAVGLLAMAFCVAEGLAMDDELAAVGAKVGPGVWLAYCGGAASALAGALLRSTR